MKIRGIVEILINPTLYFVKTIADLAGQGRPFMGKEAPAKKGNLKVRKIKENHIILMLTLAKRCLEDG